MKCTVIRIPAAEEELTRIWLDSDDRPAITQASNQIDQLLKIDPEKRANRGQTIVAY